MNAKQRVAYLTRVREVIRRNGWAVQGVVSAPDAAEQLPPMAYTVGLTEMGLAELIIMGLPRDAAAGILNAAASEHIRDDLVPGREYHLGNLPVRVVPISVGRARQMLAIAWEMYGYKLSATQLLWPSPAGKWPDHPDWDGGGAQQMLDERPEATG